MSDAVITTILGFLVTIITVVLQNNKTNALLEERMKQTNTLLEERDKNLKEQLVKLENKVESHNNFGLQLAHLETRVDILEKR